MITDKEFSFLEKKFFKENIVDCDFLIKDLIKILNKTGFKIIDRVKFNNPTKKIGIRPFLRLFTNRYYLVYAEKIKQ